MVSNIRVCLVQLSQITETIKDDRQEHQDYQTYNEKVVKRVEKCLKMLEEESASIGPSQLTLSLKDEVVHVLSSLKNQFEEHHYPVAAIQGVAAKILKIEALLGSAQMAGGQNPPAASDLRFVLFSDIEADDKNSAILQRMRPIIESGTIPFITTRSLLRGANLQVLSRDNVVMDFERHLYANLSKWDIYQQSGIEGKEGFLIFIPKAYQLGKEDPERLLGLDLAEDGSIKKIDLQEALYGPMVKPDYQMLFSLFSKNPKHSKLFYLVAHGEPSPKAASGAKSFSLLLDFLESQNCRGLTVTSCYEGGKRSMQYLHGENEDADLPGYRSKEKAHSFPAIVRSIGDFPTQSLQEAEDNLDLYFEELTHLLNSTQGQSLPFLRQVVENVERGKLKKVPENLIKVYYPHAPEAAGGFRPLGEGERGYSLTYASVSRAKLSTNHPRFRGGGPEDGIRIKNREFVNVHPLATELPLKFFGKDPIPISMVPGRAHHYISSVELHSLSPEGYLDEIVKFHAAHKLTVNKAFVFGELKSAKGSYHQVVLQIHPRGEKRLIFRQGNDFYLSTGKKTEKISPLQYAILMRQILRETSPDPAAVRATSGGQESEQAVRDLVCEEKFWTGIAPFPEELIPFLDRNHLEISGSEALNTAKVQALSGEDKVSLTFFLIRSGRAGLAQMFMQQQGIDPDSVDLDGTPLVVLAVESGDKELLKALIDKGANINARNRSGMTALASAAIKGDVSLVEILLNAPGVIPDIRTGAGWSPLALSLRHNNRIFDLLLERGAMVNYLTSTGDTPLTAAMLMDNKEAVARLLTAGADPNAGYPSALTKAILSRNYDYIEMLLRAGGEPYRRDDSGKVPAIEAIKRNGPEIIPFLFGPNLVNINVQDIEGVNPLLAAIFMGNKQMIETIIQAGGNLPVRLSDEARTILRFYLEKVMMYNNDYDSLKELVHQNKSFCQEFDLLVTENLLYWDPQLLLEMIEKGEIKPNSCKGPKTPSVFETICKAAYHRYEQYGKLAEACVQKGATLDLKTPFGASILRLAEESNMTAFIELLENASKTAEDGRAKVSDDK